MNTYSWSFKDYPKKNGLKVFSCFACGGGSTMGYKLAGFEVLGCNEIDPRVNKVYLENHNPKYNFLESIRDFKEREDIPKELYDLDILDGSPPCSSFSMAGNREKDWGKEKKFTEGQEKQVLDTLFFDFIDLAKKLKPKVVISENVKGLLQGEAVKYVNKILESFKEAGYRVDFKLLDASKMGVPQKRERVFFYAIRNDLEVECIDLFGDRPRLDLEFNEKPILFKEIADYKGRDIPEGMLNIWKERNKLDSDFKDINSRVFGKSWGFGNRLAKAAEVLSTITTKEDGLITFKEPKYISVTEVTKAGSFPSDYNFLDIKPHYLIGMSVPPLMTMRIAKEVAKQWFNQK